MPGKGGLILIGTPLAIFASIFGLIFLFSGSSAAACGSGGGKVVDPDLSLVVEGYSGDQLKNAASIMNAAISMDLPRAAQVLGVMTAMGESGLKVLDHGDAAGPDSRGLFQQRSNGAWGTLADTMNPTISAVNFFRALVAIPGWDALAPTIAAHKVQRNADPYHYEKFYYAADQVVTALSKDAGSSCATGAIVFPLAPGYNMTDDYGPRPSPGAGASTWHPAVDLQHYPHNCDDTIFAAAAGVVTISKNGQISIKSLDGYTISYLHMKLSSAKVSVGDTVTPGQEISATGNEAGSFGCHLDIRINKNGSTNPQVSALKDGPAQGGPAASAGYVNPEEFYALFGMQLCVPGSCTRNFQ